MEKARARALLMLQGQDATLSVSTAARASHQSSTCLDSALYPPLVEKFYDVNARGRGHASRCACSAHAHHWTPYVDEEAAVGLVDGVDVVPDIEFSRSNTDDLFAVCRLSSFEAGLGRAVTVSYEIIARKINYKI